MARTRKSSKEKVLENLQVTKDAIQKHEESLKQLKEEQKAFEQKLREIEMGELIEIMQEEGITVSELHKLVLEYQSDKDSGEEDGE